MVLPLGERQNIAHCKKIKVDGYGYARVYARPVFSLFSPRGKCPPDAVLFSCPEKNICLPRKINLYGQGGKMPCGHARARLRSVNRNRNFAAR